MNGQLVRMMRLREQPPGSYVTKDKAAYWDGRNNKGEKVASGTYFYQFKAGEKSFVKRMVILK
jgi:flagellar hook assembly protein FlgD